MAKWMRSGIVEGAECVCCLKCTGFIPCAIPVQPGGSGSAQSVCGGAW